MAASALKAVTFGGGEMERQMQEWLAKHPHVEVVSGSLAGLSTSQGNALFKYVLLYRDPSMATIGVPAMR